jgi:hypothetical protein
MIYSGSGSYFGKVLDPIPVPVQDPDLFSTVFQQQNMVFVPNLAFSMLS